MSYDVIATEPFERKLKRLVKKYSSLKKELAFLVEELGLQQEKTVTKSVLPLQAKEKENENEVVEELSLTFVQLKKMFF